MTRAKTAEVKIALRSLLAHLQPFDVDHNHYKRRVIARLKKELLSKKPHKVEKKGGFATGLMTLSTRILLIYR